MRLIATRSCEAHQQDWNHEGRGRKVKWSAEKSERSVGSSQLKAWRGTLGTQAHYSRKRDINSGIKDEPISRGPWTTVQVGATEKSVYGVGELNWRNNAEESAWTEYSFSHNRQHQLGFGPYSHTSHSLTWSPSFLARYSIYNTFK